MTWTTTATLPEPQIGPGWTTTVTAPTAQVGAGWFEQAHVEKVAAFSGTGTLSTNIATTYPYSIAACAGTGILTAVVKPIKTVTATFSTTGTLIAFWLETKTVIVNFTSGGELATVINDGLSAIIVGGATPVDGLSAIVVGAAGSFTALLSGAGTLSAITAPILGIPATLAGTGTLTADEVQRYAVAAGFGDI